MLIAYVVIALLAISIILMVLTFCDPELLTRWWKSLVRAVRRAVGQPAFTLEQEEAKAKASKLVPYMALADQIEQITPGQLLRYKIPEPETWGGDFITVELNPQYPQKGRKYILSIENAVSGMPGREKTIIYDSDQSIEIANSVHDRKGEPFVIEEETTVSTEKESVDAKKEAGSAGKTGTVV
jgi:hypothetical protein